MASPPAQSPPLQLYPSRALSEFILGASLHDILTRVKAQPQRYPKIEIIFDKEKPVLVPVVLGLSANGIRLRFDGPDQRLRLVEVVDFSKNHLVFKDRDLVKPMLEADKVRTAESFGPTFKHVYHKLLGPTYAGEFIPPPRGETVGVYVLSYPGVAFNFPMSVEDYAPSKDVVALFHNKELTPATSMAVFNGESWAKARGVLYTEDLASIRTSNLLPKKKDTFPDEISLLRAFGGGKIQLFRNWTAASFWIHLGETTVQEIVAELGPPDAIYRKNDNRMTIHRPRATSTASRPNGADLRRLSLNQPEEQTDTDQSSAHTASDYEDRDDDSGEHAVEEADPSNPSGPAFYNYFYHGFDILVDTPAKPSPAPPGQDISAVPDRLVRDANPDRLVAAKVVVHGNVPGSYVFNRHRRLRWEVAYAWDPATGAGASSETPFADMEPLFRETWEGAGPPGAAGRPQRGMVLNRGWGDSPGSSIELLGGDGDSRRAGGDYADSSTTLYGFPGVAFEVLKNGYVSTLTVY